MTVLHALTTPWPHGLRPSAGCEGVEFVIEAFERGGVEVLEFLSAAVIVVDAERQARIDPQWPAAP